MQLSTSRHARKDESAPTPGSSRRPRRRLYWAGLLAAIAVALSAVSAQAATGGLSSAGSADGASSSSEGEETLFSSPMRSAGASWYGPGLYGRRTACGETLRPGTIGVAHRSLPCGTTVKFIYHGHALVTQVIDRGPYVKGRSWDLTNGAREALEFEGVDTLQYAVALSPARHSAR
jgi:rare lipoprotein A (peptidoglycan hydrolase)